jgi:hypothetical protein
MDIKWLIMLGRLLFLYNLVFNIIFCEFKVPEIFWFEDMLSFRVFVFFDFFLCEMKIR